MKASCVVVLVQLLLSSSASAADHINASPFLSELNNPTSVAIRPGGSAEAYEVFVAESGARRVIRVSNKKPDAMEVVIGEFPDHDADSANMLGGNPHGLLFLDSDQLVAGIVAGTLEVRLYELRGKKDGPGADQPKQAVKVEATGEASLSRLGAITGVVRTRMNDYVGDMLILSSNSDKSPSMWSIPIRAGTMGSMTQFKGATGDEPLQRVTAMTISPQGYIVSAIEGGTRQKPRELVFQNPKSGEVVMRVPTQMQQIVGLQYEPRSGNLYAVGATAKQSGESGVFRFDEEARPSKVADIARPTSLAFGPDGALYVTALGEAGNGSSQAGVLLRLTGKF